jgi:hypothetical protein
MVMSKQKMPRFITINLTFIFHLQLFLVLIFQKIYLKTIVTYTTEKTSKFILLFFLFLIVGKEKLLMSS